MENQHSKVYQAYEFFKNRNFFEARNLYLELSNELGERFFLENLKICNKKLNNTTQTIKPKVSILIPVYNNTIYLRECLESVINQTLKEIEIIIINDGSTDIEAINILNKYAKEDTRIILINKKNTGYGHSMNLAINIAKGEYFGIVESDDYIDKNMYSILYYNAKKYKLDIIKSNIATVIGNIKERKYTYYNLVDNKYYDTIINPADNPQIFDYSGFLAIWSSLYKTSFIKENHLFFSETPGASYQDIAFWFKSICLSKRYYYVNKTLYFVRRDNENSSVYNSEKLLPVCYEFMKIKHFLNKDENLKNIFYKFYVKRMFLSYRWNMERTTYELKKIFSYRFRADFNELYFIKKLNLDYFNKDDKIYLENILDKNYNKIACIYTSHLANGGLERTACDLSFILKDKGYIVYFILIYPNKISYEYYGEIIYKDLKNPILKEILHKCKVFFDYKYKDKIKDDDLIKYCIDNYAYKYIATIHNEGDRVEHYFNITYRYLRHNLSKLKNIICVSEKVKISFEEYYGQCSNIKVIYNMIDIEKSKRLLELSPSKKDSNYILFAGRLDAYYIKGLDLLIPAFLESNTSNDSYLYLAGSGTISIDLQNLINNHPKGKKIKFLGFVDLQYEGWLKNCNFLVAPSRYEGFSMLLLEALASGVPVLTSKAGGAQELISQNYNGYIIDELSISKLIQAIDIMSKKFLLMKKNCIKSVEKFDKKIISSEFNKLLTESYIKPSKIKPLISIIIPVFNAEKYISKCIQSVLNQNIGNFEIICIDDGSTDSSKKIIYSFDDERINYYYQTNSGSGAARNKGIKLAEGEYIAFLDADDMLPHNNTYSTLYKNAKKHSVNISGANLYYIDKRECLVENKNKEMLFSQNCIIYYEDWQYDYCYQNFIYNTNFLKSNNLNFPKYRRFQDPVFFVKSMYKSKKFCVLNDYSYCYRVRQDKDNWMWSEEMVVDLISAATENLIFSNTHNLSKLHNYTVKHLESFNKYIEQLIDNSKVKHVLNNFLMNINMDFIKDPSKYNLPVMR